MKRVMAFVLAMAMCAGLLAGCGAAKVDKIKGSDSLYVKKVEGLPASNTSAMTARSRTFS